MIELCKDFTGVMMKKALVCAILFTVLTLSLTACGTTTVTADENTNGETVKLKQGQTLKIKIDGNPTTGYSWNLTDVDQEILAPLGEPDYASSSTLVGAGGTYTFIFKAVAPGSTTLKLDYFRTFEKENPPADTFQLSVIVKQ
jgi:inhibitor of cysteine peptidase